MIKGQLRLSQVLSTYGPGSLLDLPDTSVILSGLEHWSWADQTATAIEEPRLLGKIRKILGPTIKTLQAPPKAADPQEMQRPNIKGFIFPTWFLVQKTEKSKAGYQRRRLVHESTLQAMRYQDFDKKKYPVVPVRWVRACRKGHIGDIDWKAFVHGTQAGCVRDLWIEERGTSGDLDEIWAACECGAERAMSQAARLELKALGSCNGSRPWLGAYTKEKCGEPNRLLIRSASNAYFPQLQSVISIPDPGLALQQAIHTLWDFLSDAESAEDIARERRKTKVAPLLTPYTDLEVFDVLKQIKSGAASDLKPVKHVELDALTKAGDELGSDVPEGDFFARRLKLASNPSVEMERLNRVVLVHRLREVVAQVGFTRFEAAGPDVNGELSLEVKAAPLSIKADWVPAVENRGEGIFLLLETEAVKSWLARPEVLKRGQKLKEGFDLWKAEHPEGPKDFPGLAYYLLHSLSHLLLTAVSLDCGYPASSLKERIYCDGESSRYGILVFTGTSDSEGTLGGLVHAGRNISRHLRAALELGRLCSNDPVCALHAPREHDHQPLLGSACHGCVLVPETSCEQFNNFLDRSLVVATVEGLGAEFFAGAA